MDFKFDINDRVKFEFNGHQTGTVVAHLPTTFMEVVLLDNPIVDENGKVISMALFMLQGALEKI
jgi:hypothetical protein